MKQYALLVKKLAPVSTNELLKLFSNLFECLLISQKKIFYINKKYLITIKMLLFYPYFVNYQWTENATGTHIIPLIHELCFSTFNA